MVQTHVVLDLVRQDIEAVPVVGADPGLQAQELTWEGGIGRYVGVDMGA